MRILNQSRLYLFVIIVMTLVLSTTSWAQNNDIISYHVLSESLNEVVIEINSYYSGSHGPTNVVLGVVPVINHQATGYIGYGSDSKCTTGNVLSIGNNTNCFTLKADTGVNQFDTNELQICMYKITDSSRSDSFYCSGGAPALP